MIQESTNRPTQAPEDAFDVLGIDPRFSIDVDALDRRVRELSRALHPDRYSSSPAGERRRALGRAIDVNEAQRLLKDPVRRGELLRARISRGAEAAEMKASPAFLMEMMELREALSDARQKRDLDRAVRLVEPVKEREEAALHALDELFSRGLNGGSVDLTAIDSALAELRYLRRIIFEAREMEDEP